MNYKCKQCKTKKPVESEIVGQGINRFCSKQCRRTFTAEANKKAKEREKIKKTNAKETQKYLRDKLDRIVSEYIRLRDSDENGMIQCISCEKPVHWKEANCCHWIGRGNKQYRFDEENLASGCTGCNMFHKEFHQRIFTKKQIQRLGLETVEIMLDNAKHPYSWTKQELKQLTVEYNEKLSKMRMNKATMY